MSDVKIHPTVAKVAIMIAHAAVKMRKEGRTNMKDSVAHAAAWVLSDPLVVAELAALLPPADEAPFPLATEVADESII